MLVFSVQLMSRLDSRSNFQMFTLYFGRHIGAHQAPVVQRLDNAIHRINHYPADSVVCFVDTYPLDSVIQPLNNRGHAHQHGVSILSSVKFCETFRRISAVWENVQT